MTRQDGGGNAMMDSATVERDGQKRVDQCVVRAKVNEASDDIFLSFISIVMAVIALCYPAIAALSIKPRQFLPKALLPVLHHPLPR